MGTQAMKKLFNITLMAAALGGIAGSMVVSPAIADELISEVRNIDAKVHKVNLHGKVNTSLVKGATASLKIFADKDHLKDIVTVQDGDTLTISTPLYLQYKGPLRAELVLPELEELSTIGFGAVEVNGVSGDNLKLHIAGNALLKLSSGHKNVDIVSTSAGPVELDFQDSNRIEMSITGGSRVHFKGHSKAFNLNVLGFGTVTAKDLITDAVVLNLSGVGGASVFAKQSADILVRGSGTATVYGKPVTRKEKITGRGRIVWQ
jgi:hypothetical protein